MRLLRSLLGLAEHSSKWRHASQPDPKISQPWRDEFWPPSKWYEMPDIALGEVPTYWRFDNPNAAKNLVGRMTKEQLLLWAVTNVAGQVCNGGFSQALYNSYGELAEESITGLRTFGLIRHAEIFDEAFTLFGVRPVPRDRDSRIEHLEILANIEKEASKSLHFIDHTSAVFDGTSKRWESLQSEFFGLLNAKTHGDGYNAAFYRPIAEWIYEHRSRFFIAQ